MNTPQARHLPYLDGWRGLAITFLLIGHFFPVPGINLGTAGVNLFFVLSGLLMARLLFVDAVPIDVFYRRRIARIFPPVFFFLAAIVLAWLALGRPVDWFETVAAALFLNNYFPGEPGAAVMPFGHIWSLSVEEHSYVVLSIVAVAARAGQLGARRTTGMLVVALAGAGLAYWLGYRGERFEFERAIRSEVAAFGIFASAFLLLHLRGRKTPTWPLLVPVLLGFGLAMHWWSVPAPARTILGVGAFALAVNLLAGAPGLIHAALSFGPLRQLGLWSFSIYLWQQPFYLAVHREGLAPWAGAGLAILAGIASFYLLERPARTWINRKWAPRRAPAAAAPLTPARAAPQ